MKLYSNQLC